MTAADRVLSGMPAEKKPEAALDPSKESDAQAIARLVELEQRARQDTAQLTEAKAALEQERARLAKLTAAQSKLESGDPLGALSEMGLSYEQLTAAIMQGGTGTLEPVTAELAELKRQIEEMPKTYEEKIAAIEQARLDEREQAWRADTARVLTSDDDRWGLVMDKEANGGKDGVQLIFETIEAHHRETGGELLTVEAAADMMEKALERRWRQHATQPREHGRIMGLTQVPTAPPGHARISPVVQLQPSLAAPSPSSSPSCCSAAS